MGGYGSILAGLALMAGTLAFPTGATGDPSTPATVTFEFTQCSGPAGTPSEFEAVKQPGNAAAVHLSDGRGVFIAVSAVDAETGELLFETAGFDRNGLATVSCALVNPRTGREQLVTGLMVPAA